MSHVIGEGLFNNSDQKQIKTLQEKPKLSLPKVKLNLTKNNNVFEPSLQQN
jgi:hypothetical protein